MVRRAWRAQGKFTVLTIWSAMLTFFKRKIDRGVVPFDLVVPWRMSRPVTGRCHEVDAGLMRLVEELALDEATSYECTHTRKGGEF
jgi:hypothetical protein